MLGTGSHGTVVLAGRLGRRRVAVKRMLRSLGEHAAREVRALVACDAHPNVLRFYLREARGPIVPALAPALALARTPSSALNPALQDPNAWAKAWTRILLLRHQGPARSSVACFRGNVVMRKEQTRGFRC